MAPDVLVGAEPAANAHYDHFAMRSILRRTGSRDAAWEPDVQAAISKVVGVDLDGRPTPAELEVRASSLDDYFADRRVDFVKLDVEGAEALVLRGARRIPRESGPVLSVEFHTEDGWAGRSELLDAGYRLETPLGEQVDAGPGAARVCLCTALPG